MSRLDPNLMQRAESGDPEGHMNLAAMLDMGRHEDALNWLRKAAESGHAPARHVLGARLLVGRAAPFDPAEGAKWIHSAAQQGMPQSLALMSVLASLSSD